MSITGSIGNRKFTSASHGPPTILLLLLLLLMLVLILVVLVLTAVFMCCDGSSADTTVDCTLRSITPLISTRGKCSVASDLHDNNVRISATLHRSLMPVPSRNHARAAITIDMDDNENTGKGSGNNGSVIFGRLSWMDCQGHSYP